MGLSLDKCFWFGPLLNLVVLSLAVRHKFTRKENFWALMKFSHTFQLIKIENDVAFKQFKMNILVLI